jgi:RNA polymerase sigma factor (sigma-70 family)
VGEEAAVAAERISLLLRWRAGDDAAGTLLAQAYYAVVDAVASRWRRGSVQKLDLVQEGRLALLEALVRYDDATAAMPLTAYVVKWIEGRIQRHVMDFSGPVRITTDRDRSRFFSAGEGPAAVPIEDHIACQADSPEDLAIQTIMDVHRRDIVDRCLELLSERELEVVRRRAMADNPQKLCEIASERGISRQSVHGLEVSAMEKMRQALSGPHGMRAEWLV